MPTLLSFLSIKILTTKVIMKIGFSKILEYFKSPLKKKGRNLSKEVPKLFLEQLGKGEVLRCE